MNGTAIGLQHLVTKACIELGMPDVELLNVEGIRWTVKERVNIGPDMIRLERRLQELMARPVDLRLAPKEDRNKRAERNGRA